MREFFIRFKYLIIFSFIMVILLLFYFQSSNENKNSNFQQIIFSILYPFQKSVNFSVKSIKNFLDEYINLINVKEQNISLLEEISNLKLKLNQSIEESIQYRRLRGQLLFAQRQKDKKILTEIIGESLDNLHEIRLLNRGSSHGLKRNFSVILKEGLVGRIESVTTNQSVLQIITDFRSRVPALIQRNRVRGLIFGTQKGLQMRQINRRVKLELGDRIITSGLGGLYPKGILIGTISNFENRPYELFQHANIEPTVDFSSMEEVFVIISESYQSGKPFFNK